MRRRVVVIQKTPASRYGRRSLCGGGTFENEMFPVASEECCKNFRVGIPLMSCLRDVGVLPELVNRVNVLIAHLLMDVE